ncbi:alpha/beta fold hydrolase [Agrobacterium rhizogenes]|uniref:alpha/beta fold hydrolase n=1 Tax=Rhizobium rhizogenes TaxID=359 RepID=UPI00080F7358|nr:alpha/beta fold hydrolase [Rhizobium rhizogenes]OCJ22491.1 3-oxoadipate enol-lactonase [Agrobacterium sp. B131/95]OCJ28519.1 3-oxoadipate enol-lactonase [Agrobacterium sp. B133/95]NTI46329.1 alpha/beta fold hydrolase [Rhizobium rhizogenes]NTI53013.1 alpha/beta fold hydrolase [Rhizobium rhizogenes]NTI98386.1 alpha/beta fold hydrolase [Rhizobium rhizogenes]
MTELNFVTVGDGTRIAYRFDGDAGKPVLVLSNSIATTLHMWDGQIEDLSKHLQVLRYDFRGHGGSSTPAGAYSLDRLGRDVIEMLDALGVKRAHFLGLSLGGMVGQWLGVRAPERIDRLVLCNTSSHLGPASYIEERIVATLQAPDMAQNAEAFLANWFPAAMVAANGPIIEEFRAMLLSIDRQGLAGLFAAVRDSDLRRIVTLVSPPTLVIAGRYDTVTALSHSEQIAASVQGAELVVLPAVHLSNVEYPVEFIEAVLDFLR